MLQMQREVDVCKDTHHAPPVLEAEMAICTPDTKEPAKSPARVLVPNRVPCICQTTATPLSGCCPH